MLKTRSSVEICEKYSYVVHEPFCFEENSMQKEWNGVRKS